MASMGLGILWRLLMKRKKVLRARYTSNLVSGLPWTVARNISMGSGRRGRLGQDLAKGKSLSSYHEMVAGLRLAAVRLAMNSRTACSVLMV